jgi:hypothetical protein
MLLRSVRRGGQALASVSSKLSAIKDAIGNRLKRDCDRHVIAIGPFAVGPS